MITTKALPIIEYKSLYCPGGYIFYKNGNALILTKQGNTALIKEHISKELEVGMIPSPVKTYLLQRGVLRPVSSKSNKTLVAYFIIDLVKGCNFNCIYCFRDLKDSRIISFEKLNKILHFIKSYCEEKRLYRIGLQMWGGEPLLALDRIEYVINYFSKTKITVIIDIETNASLVTDEIAKKLYDLGIQIGISIDGPPELHNKQRPLVNGSPSSCKVERGIRHLQNYYHDAIGGITVVTKYNYKHVKEMLDYYIYHLKLKSLKFNIARDNPNATITNLSLNTNDVSWFINELYDYLLAYNHMNAKFTEGNIETRIRNLLCQCSDNLCISGGCKGGTGIISFSHDGGIFPCEMTDFEEERIGSIYSNYSLDEMINEAIIRNKFFLKKESSKCEDCPWWCYCKGGCTSRNLYIGKYGKPDNCECAINKTIYPKLVEGILDGIIRG